MKNFALYTKLNYYDNNKKLYKTVPSFQASVIKPVNVNAGRLNGETSNMVKQVLHAYLEIKAALEKKTELGIQHLMEICPDVTIKENLIFHNCGEDGTSISIRGAESDKYKCLTHISRRIINPSVSKHTVIEAYMLEGSEKLISNFKPAHSNHFPETRTHISQETIDSQELDKKLMNILEDLDKAMLKFRVLLTLNNNIHMKLPDGKMPYLLSADLRQAFRICDGLEESSEKLPKKVLLDVNRNFPEYLPATGMKSYAFQNLGEEKLTINLNTVDKDGENYKRLIVTDSEGVYVKSFLIQNNEKFVSNLVQNVPTNFPRKLAFANSEEMEKDFLPDFQKYFKLYFDKLKEYQTTIEKSVIKYQTKDEEGEIEPSTQELFSEAYDWYNLSKIKLRKLLPQEALRIKAKFAGFLPDAGQRGAWFNNFDGNKIINFMPVNSNKHSGLCRITVLNPDAHTTEMFLLKDFKYVVKNFNPKYPQVLPVKLIYVNPTKIKELNLEKYARFLKVQMEELASVADEAYEMRSAVAELKARIRAEDKARVKIRAAEIKANAKAEVHERALAEVSAKAEAKMLKEQMEVKYKQLVRECKEHFNVAIKNLNNNFEGFNKALAEIQEKVAQFYNENNKK